MKLCHNIKSVLQSSFLIIHSMSLYCWNGDRKKVHIQWAENALGENNPCTKWWPLRGILELWCSDQHRLTHGNSSLHLGTWSKKFLWIGEKIEMVKTQRGMSAICRPMSVIKGVPYSLPDQFIRVIRADRDIRYISTSAKHPFFGVHLTISYWHIHSRQIYGSAD